MKRSFLGPFGLFVTVCVAIASPALAQPALPFAPSPGGSPFEEARVVTGNPDGAPIAVRPSSSTHFSARQEARTVLGSADLRFIANAGQAAPEVLFHVEGAGHTVLFAADAVTFSRRLPGEAGSAHLRVHFEGARPNPEVKGTALLPGVVHFYQGSDPARWQTGMKTYDGVRYRSLYDGIDLVYTGHGGLLKRTFHVAPHTDLSLIRMAYDGAEALYLRDDGALVAVTPLGELVETAPLIYQEIDGHREDVEGRYVLRKDGTVGFALGPYRPGHPLVIDPVISSHFFLGGTRTDNINGLVMDADGHLVAVGWTFSTDFPTRDPVQAAHGGNADVFVTRLNPEDGTVLYSTFLGGTGSDSADEVIVDDQGTIYVVGETSSPNFPTLNAIQPDHHGKHDVFVARLNADGTLAFSTYLGGADQDRGRHFVLAADGDLYLTGSTESDDFPTTADAAQAALAGGLDAFVARLRADGSTLVYATFLGGTGDDAGYGLALDGDGSLYLAGSSTSTDFATGTASGSGLDAFALKLRPDAAPQIAGSFRIGGAEDDTAWSIAVHPATGMGAIVGTTLSEDLATSSDANQPAYGGGPSDAFVGFFHLESMGLPYLTYFGGVAGEDLFAVDLIDGEPGKSGTADSVMAAGSTTSFVVPGVEQDGNGTLALLTIAVVNPVIGTTFLLATLRYLLWRHAAQGRLNAVMARRRGSSFYGAGQAYNQATNSTDGIIVAFTPDPTQVAVDEQPSLPDAFALHRSYPNPFNRAATIPFEIPRRTRVRLQVYDGLGRKVVTLVDHEQGPGRYIVPFDASDLPAGVYFYHIEADSFRDVKTMLLVK